MRKIFQNAYFLILTTPLDAAEKNKVFWFLHFLYSININRDITFFVLFLSPI